MSSYAAFVTGSRAYGKPREDSDLDLVVFATPETLKLLNDHFEVGEKYEPGIALQFTLGKLNLIACTSPERFHAWRLGTETLKTMAPVTREQACEYFKTLFAIADGGVRRESSMDTEF